MGALDQAKLRSVGQRAPTPDTKPKGLDHKSVEDKARAVGGFDPYVGLNVRWFEQKEIEEKARTIRGELRSFR